MANNVRKHMMETEAQRASSSKAYSKEKDKAPLDPSYIPTLREIGADLLPSLKKWHEEADAARNLMGLGGYMYKQNPLLAMDMRPLGAMLERAFPRMQPGISKFGNIHPWTDKLLDTGAKLLDTRKSMANAEAQALLALLTKTKESGLTEGEDYRLGYENPDKWTVQNALKEELEKVKGKQKGKGGLTENQKRIQKNLEDRWAREDLKIKRDMSNKFYKEHKDLLPLAANIKGADKILGKSAIFDPKTNKYRMPGTSSTFSRLGGPALVEFFDDDKFAGDFYQTILAIAKTKLKMDSGAQAAMSEFDYVKQILGADWRANPERTIHGYDELLEEMALQLEGREAMFGVDDELGLKIAQDFYKKIGMTPKSLRNMKFKSQFSEMRRKNTAAGKETKISPLDFEPGKKTEGTAPAGGQPATGSGSLLKKNTRKGLSKIRQKLGK